MGNPPPKPVSEPSAPMTRWQGTDNGQRVCAVGKSHGPRSLRAAESPRDLAVGNGLPVRYDAQRLPHRQLEGGAARGERELESPSRAGEVLPQLRDRRTKRFLLLQPLPWRPPRARPGLEMHQGERVGGARQQQRADGCVNLPPVRGGGGCGGARRSNDPAHGVSPRPVPERARRLAARGCSAHRAQAAGTEG